MIALSALWKEHQYQSRVKCIVSVFKSVSGVSGATQLKPLIYSGLRSKCIDTADTRNEKAPFRSFGSGLACLN